MSRLMYGQKLKTCQDAFDTDLEIYWKGALRVMKWHMSLKAQTKSSADKLSLQPREL